MNIGMMWLDDVKDRSLEEKVERAAAYYQQKYGHMPNLCMVSESSLAEDTVFGEIKVQPAKFVRPGLDRYPQRCPKRPNRIRIPHRAH